MAELEGERVRLVAVAADALTEVILIDHKLRRVTSGVGRIRGQFAPGFYKVKLAAGGRFEEQLIELPPGQEEVHFKGPPIRLQSAAPLAGEAPAAHQEAAAISSRRLHREIGHGSQIFLFVRDPHGEERSEPWRGVSIQTPAGQMVLDLEKEGDRSVTDGFAGATVALAPGSYVLSVDTLVWGVQQMSLVASPGWQTQVFLNARKMVRKAPDASSDVPPERIAWRADLFTASIAMSRLDQGFDPAHPINRLVEIARLSLERGRNVFRSSLPQSVVLRELENPMLTLLSAPFLLPISRRPKISLRTPTYFFDRLESRGIAEHPDLHGFDLRRRERFETPPMLRATWRRIVRATAAQPYLIPPDSLASRIAAHVIGNSAWLVWRRPGPAEEKRETRDVRRGGGSNRISLEKSLQFFTILFDNPSSSADIERMPTGTGTGLPSEDDLPGTPGKGPLSEDFDVPLAFSITRGASPRLGFLERNLLQVIESSVQASGGRPPKVEELVEALGLPAANIEELLEEVLRKRRF